MWEVLKAAQVKRVFFKNNNNNKNGVIKELHGAINSTDV
jgi:hypothetical protein